MAKIVPQFYKNNIFLISFITPFHFSQDYPVDDVPVILIGNKSDLTYDRMVSQDDGEKMCHDLGCSAFKELSVRENIDEVIIVNPTKDKHHS